MSVSQSLKDVVALAAIIVTKSKMDPEEHNQEVYCYRVSDLTQVKVAMRAAIGKIMEIEKSSRPLPDGEFYVQGEFNFGWECKIDQNEIPF